MAIVSRSCRLAGFYRLDFTSLSLSLIFARTSSSFPSFPPSLPKGSILPRQRVPRLAGRPKARRVFLSKYSPVVISRKTPFFSPETGEILTCTSIAEERERKPGEEKRLGKDKRERASTRRRVAGRQQRRGGEERKAEKGRNAAKRESCTSNVARREIASFPNPLCVFWLDWPPPLPPVRSFSYISHPCATPPSFDASILSLSLSLCMSRSHRLAVRHFGPTIFSKRVAQKIKKDNAGPFSRTCHLLSDWSCVGHAVN